MKYITQSLGKYIDVISGYAFKSKDFTHTGIPVIKIKNVTPPEVTLDDLSYVSEELANSLPKFQLSYGDVLIALTGSHINQMASVVGRVARVKYSTRLMLNQRVGKIVVTDETACNLDYVYYYLSQEQVKISLASKAGGAANQANISPSDVKELNIPLPPIEIQRRIADILSAYDDLIENNRKQIKLLEEAAMRLYKEWFVHLRFPGHENTLIVDGVPEGWERKKLIDISDVIMGQSPKSEYYNNKQQGLPFHQGVTNYGYRFVIDEIYSTSYTRIAEPGSILFSVRAPVGRMNLTKNKIVIGRGLAAINHKKNLQSFLFYMLKDRFYKDNLIGNGAIYASITKDALYAQEFLVPDDNLSKKFNTIANEIDKRIANADKQIALLQQARDKLLPKLMSGEIEV